MCSTAGRSCEPPLMLGSSRPPEAPTSLCPWAGEACTASYRQACRPGPRHHLVPYGPRHPAPRWRHVVPGLELAAASAAPAAAPVAAPEPEQVKPWLLAPGIWPEPLAGLVVV